MKMNTSILKISFTTTILFTSCFSTFAQNRQTKNDSLKIKKVEIIFGENGEATIKDITQKRNMTQYEQGGNFDCRTYIFNGKRGECDKNKFRDFIWQNWFEKKRAYVRVTENSPDVGGTFHYFIEPDKNGEWSIIRRLVRWHALPPGIREIVDFPKVFSVEQIKDKTNKENWTLVFKDKAGKISSEY